MFNPNLSFRISLLFLLCLREVRAQNLVPDSSFEYNHFIPIEFSAINASRYWDRPGMGTSDLFCKCGKKQRKSSLVNVPQNPMGIQHPRSGICYGGIFAFSHGAYREYVQTPLSQPLEKGKSYRFRMYISLADYSRTAIDQLGVCFLNREYRYNSSNVITDLKPLYLKIDPALKKDTVHWQALTIVYKASGGESYLLIGSFNIREIVRTKVKAPKEARSRINQSTERDAYYYIDDVSLSETEEPVPAEELLRKPAPEALPLIPKHYVLKNVLFETGKTHLQPAACEELDRFAEYLRQNPGIQVEIGGHTDNTGSVALNKKLSGLRAKAVSDYLISKGADKSLVSFKGYGSALPIATNETEEGRSQNRRVEFVMQSQ